MLTQKALKRSFISVLIKYNRIHSIPNLQRQSYKITFYLNLF